MHGVNLDLLRTGPHQLNGQPKDPHAHHRAELRALQRAARRQRWLDGIARLRARFAGHPAPLPQACPNRQS